MVGVIDLGEGFRGWGIREGVGNCWDKRDREKGSVYYFRYC